MAPQLPMSEDHDQEGGRWGRWMRSPDMIGWNQRTTSVSQIPRDPPNTNATLRCFLDPNPIACEIVVNNSLD